MSLDNYSDEACLFLDSLLFAVRENNSNDETAYAIIEENLDLLDSGFVEKIKNWIIHKLAESKTTKSSDLAKHIGNLCYLISNFLPPQNINIEIAIAGYKSIESAFEYHSENWAIHQSNLGTQYYRRQDNESLKAAICCYKASLEVYKRQKHPLEWAEHQFYLGNIYQELSETNNAVIYYKKSLEVFSIDLYPSIYAEALFALGIIYKSQKDFCIAYKYLSDSIKAFESFRNEVVLENYDSLIRSNNDNAATKDLVKVLSEEEAWIEANQKFADEWHSYYREIIEVCLEIDYLEQAVEYIEYCKTFNSIRFLSQHKNELNFELICFDRILKEVLTDRETSIVEWFITPNTIATFVISQQFPQVQVWQPHPAEREKVLQALETWSNKYFDDYEDDGEGGKIFNARLQNFLKTLGSTLHLDRILSLIPESCKQLILIPHFFLHQLPLHALPIDNKEGLCLLDRFSDGIRYAPSCYQLYVTKNHSQHKPISSDLLPSLIALSYSEDLLNSEVMAIKRFFHHKKVLVQSEATKEAFYQELSTCDLDSGLYIHFSTHAFFGSAFSTKCSGLQLSGCNSSEKEEELNSGLYLMDEDSTTKILLDKCLTIGDIYALRLQNCHLVTLSSCETSVSDYSDFDEGYISLVSSFIFAGVPSAVGSLWGVNDLATTILMIKFYENLSSFSVCVALNQAQIWLRDITKAKLQTWIEENKTLLAPTVRIKLRRYITKVSDGNPPFKKPFYWAGFRAIGW